LSQSEPVDQPKNQAAWKSALRMFSIAAVFFVGLRGFVISRLIGGYYSWSSFLFDAIAAVLILFVLQLLDLLLTKGLTGLIGEKSKGRKIAIKLIRLVIIVLIPGTFLLATAQMHPPKIGCLETPQSIELEFTAHTIETNDGLSLSAWTIPAKDPDRPVIVMTHGLGANKQNFLPISKLLHECNFNVVSFDFRAHGDSEGHTCTLGVLESNDIKAAYDLATKQFPDRPIYCWSTSLGGAAALRAAAEFKIFDKLVVDASFASVKNVAMDTKFCYLGPLGSSAWNISRLWYFTYVGKDIEQFAPANDIALLKIPVFLIHGTADKIIPYNESNRLQAAAAPGTELWLVQWMGHSQSFLHPKYKERMSEFFDAN